MLRGILYQASYLMLKILNNKLVLAKSGVSNSNCCEGQMKTYKVTWGSHHDANTTMVAREPYQKQFLHLISCKRYCEF